MSASEMMVLCALTETEPLALTVAPEPMLAQTCGVTSMNAKLALKAPMPADTATVLECGATVELAPTPSDATDSTLAPSSTAA